MFSLDLLGACDFDEHLGFANMFYLILFVIPSASFYPFYPLQFLSFCKIEQDQV